MADPRTSEDRFVAGLLQFLTWAQRNTRSLILGIGAVAVVGFGVKYYIDFKLRVRQTAATEMRTIRMQFEQVEPSGITEALRAYLLQFDGTDYAREARVLLAESLLLQNRAAEAIEPARTAMDKLGQDLFSLRAAFLLAAAYEEVGDTTAAIAVYREIGNSIDRRVQKSRGLEGAARLLAARGDYSEAAALYEQLAELTPPDAPAKGFYQLRAAEMRQAQKTPVTQQLGAGDPGTEEG